MVTNLPPEAEAQYRKVVASKSKEEKLENLRIFLSMIPEHKGTEKLRAQVKRQISRLQEEVIVERKRRSSKTVAFEKGENTVLTVVLARDKWLLHESLNAIFDEQSVSESLNELKPLSMPFQDIVLSFIPLSVSMVENRKYSLIQTIVLKSDLILLILQGADPLEEFNLLKKVLGRLGIYVASKNSIASFKSLKAGGITVLNNSRFLSNEQVKVFLNERGFDSGIVSLAEFASTYTLESTIRGLRRKNFLILFKDYGEEGSLARQLEVPEESLMNMEDFREGKPLDIIFKASEVIRVYLKPPSSSNPSSKPMLVNKDTTVRELASMIHAGLSEELKYARLWRGGFGSTPVRVNASSSLMDKDVVELRTR
jgi:ribosome-interacting GTPase 1